MPIYIFLEVMYPWWDSNPHCDDFKSSVSTDWTTWTYFFIIYTGRTETLIYLKYE